MKDEGGSVNGEAPPGRQLSPDADCTRPWLRLRLPFGAQRISRTTVFRQQEPLPASGSYLEKLQTTDLTRRAWR